MLSHYVVDGFQGREKDIIILSCVRSNAQRQLGFVADARRLNVAITRAKNAMWIIGSSQHLARNAIWKSLIEDARDRKRYIQDSEVWTYEAEQRLHSHRQSG